MSQKHQELENYFINEKIGQGVFSKVYRASHKLTDEQVAVKIYDKLALENAHRREMIQSEIDILKTLNHRSIIKYKDFHEDAHKIYIILELFKGVPLNQYVEKM